ncbi:MAG: membrane protein insertase YidC [Desulfohalobiaceae bacterium]|nr:membrane protein insertase YidC [Desulfohalobiaceae bacterium]
MTENWRILLALALTMLVLIAWNMFFSGQQGIMGTDNQTRQVERQTGDQAAPSGKTEREQADRSPSREESVTDTAARQDLAAQESEVSAGETVSVETPLYQAVFSKKGGVLKHFRLKQYKSSIKEGSDPVDLIGKKASEKAPFGLLWNQGSTWREARWRCLGDDMRIERGEQDSLTLIGEMGNLTLRRKLTFRAGTYGILEEVEVVNRSEGSISGALAFTLASPTLVENPGRYNYMQFLTYSNGGLTSWDDKDTLSQGVQTDTKVQWCGVGSSYFLLAMDPKNTSMYSKGKYEDEIYRAAAESRVTLEKGQSRTLSLEYYLGPQDAEQLKEVSTNLQAAVNFGWFNVIAKPLVRVLQFFHSFIGNYGLAIILLTLVIKIVFWPLSHKSYKSMEKMKKIQPMMKELKEKYKDDRQKMNQELMQLYKTYKVNPAGGCLPMLLQIPVFIGLFEGLMGSVALRHSPFISHLPFTDIVWLADLASKDPLYITPVLMGLSMFLQQKLSPTAGDPTQAKVMMFMPIFLTFIFLNFPAGLVVYFITNNLLSIAQQTWIMRKA